MNASLFGTLAAIAILMPRGATSAQERPDTARLVPVVVTATRVPAGQAVPTTTATRIEGTTLRQRGIRLVSDALREVPGLTVSRAGSAGAVTSVFIRGGESDYLQVLVDGVLINEPGGAIDLANLTTEDVDRIEVVRGPASVLYGSEAVSGVIQIFTRRGRGAPVLSVGARAGSRQSTEADGALRGQAGMASYSVNAAHAATDGVLPFNNAHRSTSLGGTLGTLSDDGKGVQLTARYADGRYHFPTGSGGELSDSNQFSFERRFTAGATAARRIGRVASAQVSLSSSTLDAGTDDAPDNAADTLGAYASRSRRSSTRQGADLRVDIGLPTIATLSAGVDLDWEHERTTFRSEHGTFGPFRAPESNDRRWNRGYYGQLIGDVGRTFSWTLGARLDENEAFGTFFTYRGGGGLHLSPLTVLRGSFGTAFKSPIFYELTGAGFAEPNGDIQPERSRSWDAGIEQTIVLLGREATIGATWFDQRFQDMIQYIAPDGPGLGRYENIAGASAAGLEVEARAAATDRLTMLASTTFLRTRVLENGGGELAFEEGERLIRRPRLSASATATYRFSARGGLLGASLLHVGRRDDIDFTEAARMELPSYTLVGASASLPLGSAGPLGSLQLRASAENLLGAEYSAIFGFPSPGRTLMLGVSAAIGGR